MSVTNFNYFTLLLLAFVQIPECEKAAFSFQTLKSSCQRRLLFDLHHVVVLTVALPSVAKTEITTFSCGGGDGAIPMGGVSHSHTVQSLIKEAKPTLLTCWSGRPQYESCGQTHIHQRHYETWPSRTENHTTINSTNKNLRPFAS